MLVEWALSLVLAPRMLTGMFCCGRAQEEEQPMAQEPDRYKVIRDKDAGEDKTQQQQQQQQQLKLQQQREQQQRLAYAAAATANARSSALGVVAVAGGGVTLTGDRRVPTVESSAEGGEGGGGSGRSAAAVPVLPTGGRQSQYGSATTATTNTNIATNNNANAATITTSSTSTTASTPSHRRPSRSYSESRSDKDRSAERRALYAGSSGASGSCSVERPLIGNSTGPGYYHHHNHHQPQQHQQQQPQQQQQQQQQHQPTPTQQQQQQQHLSYHHVLPQQQLHHQPHHHHNLQQHHHHHQQQQPQQPPRHGSRARVGSIGGGGTASSVLEMGIKSMEVEDDSFVVETVEIIKRPGQTLGFYIREGNGFDRVDGVFISRIQMGTVAESNGLLHVGDEILTVNNVRVGNMSLDDVVILMSIPKKLVLSIRTRRNCNKNKSCPSLALTDKDDDDDEPPIVVLKKGRSSSATALEMTEKCPDAFPPYVQYPFHPADYLQPKRDTLHDRPTSSSRYASIFISPDKAQARLLTDEGLDSGNSSDGSLPRSIDSGREHAYGGGQDIELSAADSPGSYVSPSTTMVGSGGSSNFVGDREYMKYLIPDRKQTPKSPSKSIPLAALSPSHAGYLSDEGSMYSEPPYMNLGPYREGLPIPPYRTVHEDRKSQERLRDLLQSKSRYNRLLRSRSPECYNSDSEVIFTHQRPQDSRGFASDYETYAGAASDDDGPVYSIPLMPSSSSSELEVLLQKFTTLSQELQQEQSKLQRQLSSREKGRPVHMPLARPPDSGLMDAYGHRPASSRGSPGPSRRAISTGTQTPAGVHPSSRMMSKPASESPFLYRQFTLDDQLDASKDQQPSRGGGGMGLSTSVGGGIGGGSNAGPDGVGMGLVQRPGLITGGLPLATSPCKMAADVSTTGRAGTASAGSATPTSARLRDLHFSRKPLHIPYSEFEPYRADMRKRVEISRSCGLDGLLNIHVMSGQGLKSSKTSLRDLYCVVAVDSLNKARTMIRTGAINFDWDEAFDVDLEDSKEVSFLIYHWDPSYKHRLCFHGSVLLPGYVVSGQRRYVAIKMEPKGILFVTLMYKEPALSLQRLPSLRKNALFGMDLEAVIKRENSGFNVPLLVKKCVEEVEARGLETVGIYRLCGSARRKAMLREAFEKNAAAVDLSPENVSDIHVVTGVLKDYLRELPEPLFTNALYQMLLDALSVRLPSDPEGSAKLMLSILECLPTANQDTMAMILNHLRRVASHSEKNKMTIDNLAICFGPVLLCPAPATSPDPTLDFRKHIEVLRYLLEIWEYDNGTSESSTSQSAAVEAVVSLDSGPGILSASDSQASSLRSQPDRSKQGHSTHSSHC